MLTNAVLAASDVHLCLYVTVNKTTNNRILIVISNGLRLKSLYTYFNAIRYIYASLFLKHPALSFVSLLFKENALVSVPT
jgi:hypothetical protein